MKYRKWVKTDRSMLQNEDLISCTNHNIHHPCFGKWEIHPWVFEELKNNIIMVKKRAYWIEIHFGDLRFARFPSIPTLAIIFSGLIDDMYSSYTNSEILSSDLILRFGDEYRVFGNRRLTPLVMKYNEMTPKFFTNHTFTTIYGSFFFFSLLFSL